MNINNSILWVDDEIELLRSHIIFLEEKGYGVKGVSSGEEGVEEIKRNNYDLVFLDENMPGKDGIQTLQEIKAINMNLPVIMITKNEEEGIMDQAIGLKIDDYLIKPINPLQAYLAAKKILQSSRIQKDTLSRGYLEEFRKVDEMVEADLTTEQWKEIHHNLCRWDLELDSLSKTGLEQIHSDLRERSNEKFSAFVEENYSEWMNSDNRPVMTKDVFDRFALPALSEGKQVYLLIIDCMRYDQWLMIEDLLADHYAIDRDLIYSILPSATPYSRNAIFSGLFPIGIKQQYPQYWLERADDDGSGKNRFEMELMNEQLRAKGFDKIKSKYIKIYSNEDTARISDEIGSYKSLDLIAIVVNFLDMLSHGRSHIRLLQEIAPDESAFRSLMRSWFIHSALYDILKRISLQGGTVIVTTDHGSILCKKATMVKANRETSTNLRYKFGENISCDRKYTYRVENPRSIKLPAESPTKNYIFAKSNYYFVYPTNYHKYERQYRNTFQHGGISLEEMIVPCITLEPKA
ncbi:MAG: PglZ domain-containing protein [Candidatus Latescibacteria bacterium]|nr:PglZ domain-containing protein [bacterium]MBD3425050.1 PglZ domain-containing protein [Candidatus Latescibacterota bacterium]